MSCVWGWAIPMWYTCSWAHLYLQLGLWRLDSPLKLPRERGIRRVWGYRTYSPRLNASLWEFSPVSKGCLSAALGCRREGSNCLCSCTKQQLSNLSCWFKAARLSWSLWVVSWKGCRLGIPLFYWMTSMSMWAMTELSGKGGLGGTNSLIWTRTVFCFWIYVLAMGCP